jgi:HEAT repeat protein
MPLIRKPQTGTSPPADLADVDAALQAASADERWSAARQLGGQPGHAGLLIAALGRESDARVREALFTALARDGSAEAISGILPFIRAQDAALRTAALDALATRPGAIAAHIESLLADPDRDVRILSCDLVRRLPSAEATLCLSALLARETDLNVCAAAVEVLSEVGDDRARPALEACATRFAGDGFLDYAIQVALRRIGEDRPPPASP